MNGYLAPEGQEAQLAAELGRGIRETHDRLYLAEAPARTPFWVQNVWHEPVTLTIASIGDAVKQLRAIQRNWTLYPYREHRRATLIDEQLPKVPSENLHFPSALPKHPMGSWLMLDRNTILAAARCSSPYPNGELHFAEPAIPPPSRAYLKLWEVFTRYQQRPKPGERCLDLGASPGSWSWVLAHCGADVLAIDRATLAPEVTALPHVRFSKGDAFAMTPDQVGDLDWLCSDVICYPEKLYHFVQLWLASGRCRHFVCTLKFQGQQNDYKIARAFAAIPGSEVMHLFHNKHELTWVLLEKALIE